MAEVFFNDYCTIMKGLKKDVYTMDEAMNSLQVRGNRSRLLPTMVE